MCKKFFHKFFNFIFLILSSRAFRIYYFAMLYTSLSKIRSANYLFFKMVVSSIFPKNSVMSEAENIYITKIQNFCSLLQIKNDLLYLTNITVVFVSVLPSCTFPNYKTNEKYFCALCSFFVRLSSIFYFIIFPYILYKEYY